jgi:hypothetical protein
MLNPQKEKILCMWADCERAALNKYHYDVIKPGAFVPEITHFTFCTAVHRDMAAGSHIKLGYKHPDASLT